MTEKVKLRLTKWRKKMAANHFAPSFISDATLSSAQKLLQSGNTYNEKRSRKKSRTRVSRTAEPERFAFPVKQAARFGQQSRGLCNPSQRDL